MALHLTTWPVATHLNGGGGGEEEGVVGKLTGCGHGQ